MTKNSISVKTLDCTMVLYWNSSPTPQVKKFLHFDLTVTNGIPTPDFDQIEFDVQQGNKVGPAIILGILECSSMVHPKLYISSTIKKYAYALAHEMSFV